MSESNNAEGKIRELVNHLTRLGNAAEMLEKAQNKLDESISKYQGINNSVEKIEYEICILKNDIGLLADKIQIDVPKESIGIIDLYDKFDTHKIEIDYRVSNIKKEIEEIKNTYNNISYLNDNSKLFIEIKGKVLRLESDFYSLQLDFKSLYNEMQALHDHFQKVGIERITEMKNKIEEIISVINDRNSNENTAWENIHKQISFLNDANQQLNKQLYLLKFQFNWFLYIFGAILSLCIVALLWTLKGLFFG